MIFVYEFSDGTILKLYEKGLTIDEVWKLEELHGKVKWKEQK